MIKNPIVKPFELTPELQDELLYVCKFIYPQHTVYLEDYGLLTFIKDNWTNPDSFKVGWYEFVTTVALPILCLKHETKYVLTSIATYVKDHAKNNIPPYIIKYLRNQVTYKKTIIKK